MPFLAVLLFHSSQKTQLYLYFSHSESYQFFIFRGGLRIRDELFRFERKVFIVSSGEIF